MAMTKKDFIMLADELRKVSKYIDSYGIDRAAYHLTVDAVVGFCHDANPRFNEAIFRGYIAGECGPSGGAVKKGK